MANTNTPKEAHVYVQNGGPWIACCCPVCGKTVYSSNKFCVECGQALMFNDYKRVLETGPSKLKVTGGWKRIFFNDAVKEAYLRRCIEKLEAECRIEDSPILRIMREAYIKTCFENKG